MKKITKKIIAIIPARGGSKRIPRKNIKILAGKPLISYTIDAAKRSKLISRVFVSTEDKEIAGISKKCGAEIIDRPKKIAGDNISEKPVLDNVIEYLKKEEDYQPDIIIYLQPTSPLRNLNDIDEAILLFLRNKADSLVSVYEQSPYWCLKIKKDHLEPVFSWKYFKMRSQDLPRSYMPNGAIFISTPKALRKNKSFYCHKMLPYIMPRERSIDIDYEIDFKLAELILKAKK